METIRTLLITGAVVMLVYLALFLSYILIPVVVFAVAFIIVRAIRSSESS